VKVTLGVQKLDSPELVAYDRILRRYGAGCFPQEPQDREDHWRVPIGAFLESRIVDEKTKRERILTFNLKNVGEILVKKSTMRIMGATRLRSLGKNILKKRVQISRLVEQDLIKILGNKDMDIHLSELKYALPGLQPIYRTLNRLLLGDYPTREELFSSGRHYLEQAELITDIGYAEYTEEYPYKLHATNKIKELYSQVEDMERAIEIVLGMILSEFYYDLQKGMRVAQFVPYVKASTGYYGDAIQFGKLIRMSEDRLCKNVRKYYGGSLLPPRSRYAYPTIVRELVCAKILEYDGNYITGRSDIFEKLIDIRKELPISEEPISFG
jgi:hypothetical protein